MAYEESAVAHTGAKHMQTVSHGVAYKVAAPKLATIIVTIGYIYLWEMALHTVPVGAIHTALPDMGVSPEIMGVVTAAVAVLVGVERAIPVAAVAVTVPEE